MIQYKHILVANNKAWMQTIYMCTYIDLVLINIANSNSVVIMDNFKVHSSQEITSRMKNMGIEPLFLPPNCTVIAQPLDVSINGALKSCLRQKYCSRLFESLITYKNDFIRIILKIKYQNHIFHQIKQKLNVLKM